MNHKKVIRIIAVLMASLLLLSLLASIIPMRAHADDFETQLAALNSEKDSAKERRVAAQNKVQALKDEQAAVIDEKMALEERKEACLEEISLIEEQISLINAEILLYDEKIAQKEEDVRAAKEREDLQMEKYRNRVRAMEENGGYNVLAVLFSADSFSGLLTAIDDYGEIMNSDVILYDQLQEARAAHQALEQEYREYQAECEVKKAEHEATKVGLEADKADLEGQIAEADALIEEYVAKIEAAEEEQRAAEAAEANAKAAADAFLADYYARQAAAAAAAAAAAQQTTTVYNEETGTYEEQTVSQPVQQQTGGGGSGYGQRASTGSFHSGIDIDGFQSAGAAIVAADGGTVIMAEYSGGYGNTIMIDHGGGIVTLYAHLNSMSVGVGSSVSQGQTIGGVGNTGTVYGADGVHLHFEVRVNGSTTDPLNYIGGYPHSFY